MEKGYLVMFKNKEKIIDGEIYQSVKYFNTLKEAVGYATQRRDLANAVIARVVDDFKIFPIYKADDIK